MNLPSIIVVLVIAVLAILAMRYSLKNGSSCKNCGGNCRVNKWIVKILLRLPETCSQLNPRTDG